MKKWTAVICVLTIVCCTLASTLSTAYAATHTHAWTTTSTTTSYQAITGDQFYHCMIVRTYQKCTVTGCYATQSPSISYRVAHNRVDYGSTGFLSYKNDASYHWEIWYQQQKCSRCTQPLPSRDAIRNKTLHYKYQIGRTNTGAWEPANESFHSRTYTALYECGNPNCRRALPSEEKEESEPHYIVTDIDGCVHCIDCWKIWK